PEGIRTALPADVPPGAQIAVPVTIRVLGESDRPLPVWDLKKPWVYQLEWDFFDGKSWASAAGGETRREVVEVLDSDSGAYFLGTALRSHRRNHGHDKGGPAQQRAGDLEPAAGPDRLSLVLLRRDRGGLVGRRRPAAQPGRAGRNGDRPGRGDPCTRNRRPNVRR